MAELFANFEINNSPRWPRLARLVGGSLVFHILFLACALYVPAVRDALNVASVFSDAQYVDKDYEKTIIGERAQVIDLASERFQYPEGYFSKISASTPDAQIIEVAANTPPRLPKPKPTPTPTPEPTPEASPEASPTPQSSDSPEIASNTNGNTNEGVSDEQKAPEDVEKELEKITAENKIERPSESEINKRPLKEWLARAKELRDKGELDLSGTVEIVIVGERDENGKLLNAKVERNTGDPQLAQVAIDFAGAISDSGVLIFLKDTKQLRLTVRLDQAEVTAKVESEAESPERAKKLADGYNGLLAVGQLVKRGQDEEIIYKSTKVSYKGKQVVVNFTMPRQTAGEMIKKRLPET
ncbi:MAG TPA: hypothetical protein VD966_03840 [Pyrinomonadaceae bacterium]|nr:hypothetical protein [Pyrinomonadaceae bacterium]